METSFYYKARNLAGEQVTGKVKSDTRQAALGLLHSKDLFVINISQRVLRPRIQLPKGRVRIRELAVFCRQFAIMNAAGIPLLQSLHDLGEQTTDKLLQKVISEAVVSLERGKSLSEAFHANSDSLPPIMINMLTAAEVSGSLDLALERLADNFEKEVQVREKIKSALTYPVLVAVVALLAVAVLLVYVVPIFVDVFEQVGASLPAATRLLLALSSVLRQYSPVVVLSLPLLFLAVKYAQKIKIVYTTRDRLFLTLPGVSSITIGITISRFAHTLSMLLKSGLPLLESLAVTEKVVGNSIAALEISEARRGIEAGERIAPAFLKSRVFPKMIVSMIETGEESGALVEILEKLGSYYDQDVEVTITRMASLLEPALITVVGIMVGFIALSIYLPLFGLSGSL
ncbi:MAG TPA: type II secretion system F family protein [Syntrophomonadaceae bacterium]|nr:type II secretion system F family protein [Syntrophomonadaceae bacterium]